MGEALPIFEAVEQIRLRKNIASKKWIEKNRVRVNAHYRKLYSEQPFEEKELRLIKIREMRELGLWQK